MLPLVRTNRRVLGTKGRLNPHFYVAGPGGKLVSFFSALEMIQSTAM
jgi:hypothetical protein